MVSFLVALVLLVPAMVLGAAVPANAHATLVVSDPVEGAVLVAAPAQIRLTFSEPVVVVPNGIGVYAATGKEVGSSALVRGSELTVTLRDEVGDGTLVVVWRVVSDDGHPVGGSLSFSIGAPSDSVATPSSSSAESAGVPPVLSLVRWVGYAGLLLVVGLVALSILVLPDNHLTHPARRRLRTAARVAGATTIAAWLAGLPLTALYQFGGGWGSLASGAIWSAFATSEYAAAAAVVVGVTVAVGLLRGENATRPRAAATMAAAVLAAAAPALTGHTRAATPQALAVGVDVLHLLAGSIWLGGLVGLALVLPDLSGRGSLAAELVTRFSGAAAGVLVALAVTGAILAWRIAGSWGALVETTYGRLLLVKVLLAVVVVALAAWNRYALLPRLRDAGRRRDRRSGVVLVVRTTAAEASLLVGVLLVTGFLVDRSPEPEPAAVVIDESRTGPHRGTLGDLALVANVSDHRIGPNAVTIQLLDASGESAEGVEPPRVSLSSDEVDLGVLPLVYLRPGTYTSDVVLPTSGTWALQVSLRTSEFDNPVTTIEFPVFGPR